METLRTETAEGVREIAEAGTDGNLKEWLARASADGRIHSVDVDDDNVLSGDLRGPEPTV